MAVDLKKLTTENRLEASMKIDEASSIEILEIINNEDGKIASLIKEKLEDISRVVDAAVERYMASGRVIYVGAGTSGRIGLMDAVEIPPTYSVENRVLAVLAGGNSAFVKAVEGAEDDIKAGKDALVEMNLSSNDLVIGIAASGRTPFVIGALQFAKEVGAITSCIVTTPASPIEAIVDLPIVVVTGAEVVTGSTRMKSGTAQKMICNMITTAMMIRLGKVYENLMVDVKATNEKLVERSYKIIMEATGVTKDEAKCLLDKYQAIKRVIFNQLTGEENMQVIDLYLEKTGGVLKKSIEEYRKDKMI